MSKCDYTRCCARYNTSSLSRTKALTKPSYGLPREKIIELFLTPNEDQRVIQRTCSAEQRNTFPVVDTAEDEDHSMSFLRLSDVTESTAFRQDSHVIIFGLKVVQPIEAQDMQVDQQSVTRSKTVYEKNWP